MPLVVRFERPSFGIEEAREIARERFGLEGRVEELPSERDRNFRIEAAGGARFVLKLAHSDESPQILDLQHRALERIAERAPFLRLPRLLRSRAGAEVETVRSSEGTSHLARVLTWVDGPEWAKVSPHTPELLRSLGRAIGGMDRALAKLK